jgi:NAD+ kinase
MKIAIYSRLLEEDKRSDVQFFLMNWPSKIAAAVFLPFYEEIKDRINLPAGTSTFYLSDDLTNDIEFVISLGGDGTLLDTVGLVRDKGIPIMGSISEGLAF